MFLIRLDQAKLIFSYHPEFLTNPPLTTWMLLLERGGSQVNLKWMGWLLVKLGCGESWTSQQWSCRKTESLWISCQSSSSSDWRFVDSSVDWCGRKKIIANLLLEAAWYLSSEWQWSDALCISYRQSSLDVQSTNGQQRTMMVGFRG